MIITSSSNLNEYNIDSFLYESVLLVNDNFYRQQENIIKLEHQYLIGNYDSYMFSEGVKDAISNIWTKVKEFFQKLYNWLKEKITQFISFLKRIFSRNKNKSSTTSTTASNVPDVELIFYQDLVPLLKNGCKYFEEINSNIMEKLTEYTVGAMFDIDQFSDADADNDEKINSFIEAHDKEYTDFYTSSSKYLSNIKETFGLLNPSNKEKQKLTLEYQKRLAKDYLILDKHKSELDEITKNMKILQNRCQEVLNSGRKFESKFKKELSANSEEMNSHSTGPKLYSFFTNSLKRLTSVTSTVSTNVNYIVSCVTSKVSQIEKYGKPNSNAAKSESFSFLF